MNDSIYPFSHGLPGSINRVFTSTSARTIRFVVDTGATNSLVSATDGARLGIIYNARGVPTWNRSPLHKVGDASGIGGKIQIFSLPDTFLTIISKDKSYKERHTEYIRELLVAESKYQDESLFGMDLLQRFNINIDSKNRTVDFSRIHVKGTSYLVQNA